MKRMTLHLSVDDYNGNDLSYGNGKWNKYRRKGNNLLNQFQMSYNNKENTPMIPREVGRKSESNHIDKMDLANESENGIPDTEMDLIHGNMSPGDKSNSKVTKCSIEDDIDFQVEPVDVGIEGGDWECRVCKGMFVKEMELTEHLKISYDCMIKDTCCEKCGRYFKGQKGLKSHLARSKCNDVAEVRDSLGIDDPVTTYIEDGDWECRVCKGMFVKEMDLTEHLKISDDCMRKDTCCEKCGRFFKGQRGLKSHLARSKCNDVAEVRDSLGIDDPVTTYIEDGDWECRVCKELFSNEKDLMEHLQRSYRCVEKDTCCRNCGRYFKGQKGLNTHLARAKCSDALIQPDSSCIPDTVRTLTNPDDNHSVPSRQKLKEDRRLLGNIKTKVPICWPRMNDERSWNKLDSAVKGQILNQGAVGKRINILENVVYEEAVNLFGVKKKGQRKEPQLSRRQRLLKETTRRIMNLEEAAKQPQPVEELDVIFAHLDAENERRKAMKKAENSRKKRWRRKMKRRKFYQNPFGTVKEILSPSSKVQPEVSEESLNAYLAEVAEDRYREVPLGHLDGLPEIEDPDIPFKGGKLQAIHLMEIIKKKRNASKPGPNQIPYKVYKKCPSVRNILFKMMKSVISANNVPLKWRIAEGVMIPKVDEPIVTKIEGQFRQIALMNVEAKLFWSMISRKLYEHLVKENSFIDTSIQKGAIQGTPGCWEHISMVWTALRDAREHRSSLTTIWLDLENAYGSVPHHLILFALRRYGVPERWVNLIKSYYDGLWGRTRAGKMTSDWHRYERGIFAGCTVSVILFLAAFNVIIEYVMEVKLPGYTLHNGNTVSILRAFLDDLMLMLKSVSDTKIALKRLEVGLEWARMNLKPSKSRSIVMVKGRVMDVEPYIVKGITIPSVQRKPVKALGRVVNASLTDKIQKEDLEKMVDTDLKKLDKSDLTGIMKVWGYQFMVLPRASWRLMIYEIPMSWVEKTEMKINRFLRKWLGISRNMTDVALFCPESPCALPLQSFTKEFKKVKTNAAMQLRMSKDKSVADNFCLKSSPKWKIEDAVERAESRIRLNRIVGQGQVSRAGIGFLPREEVPHPSTKAYKKMVTQLVQKEEDERLFTKAVQQKIQGSWTSWQKIIRRDTSWNTMLAKSPRLISFCLGATFDTIASPVNMQRWGLAENNNCELCQREWCDVKHVLSGCKVALTQGRYRYRHDAVLRQLSHGLCQTINELNNSNVKKKPAGIQFVKEGHATQKKSKQMDGILYEEKDWTLVADLGEQLSFPREICETNLRPDILVKSDNGKILIIIELTCPSEENLEARHSEKLEKYAELAERCREVGWKTYLFAVEVGARGYPAISLQQCLRRLGLRWKRIKKLTKEVADCSLRCSFWLWLKRSEAAWVANSSPEAAWVTNSSPEADWVNNSSPEADWEKNSSPEATLVLNSSPEVTLVSNSSPAPESTLISVNHSEVPDSATGRREAFFSPNRNERSRKILEDRVETVEVSGRLSPTEVVISQQVKELRKEAEKKKDLRSKKGIEGSPKPTLAINSTTGLSNLGNTCFMNAVLQCLWIATRKVTATVQNSNNLVTEFWRLMKKLSSSRKGVVSPSDFRRTLIQSFSHFAGTRQQDAHEFLVVMLEVLSEHQPEFSGYTRSVATCVNCGHNSQKEELFNCLTLDIPRPDGWSPVTLQNCIDESFTDEFIAEGWSCQQCGITNGAVEKKSELSHLPEVLIMQLKRFRLTNQGYRKNSCVISLPQDQLKIKDRRYRMVGVVHHMGTMNGGHYTARVRVNNRWKKCDDSRIQDDRMSFNSNDAYILVFEQL